MLNSPNAPNGLKKIIHSFKNVALKNNAVRLIFVIALLIIAFSLFYGLVVLPYQKQNSLGACLLKAKEGYNEKWTSTCLSLFSEEVIKEYSYDELCGSMAAQYADPIQQEYYTQIDDCLDKHPQ